MCKCHSIRGTSQYISACLARLASNIYSKLHISLCLCGTLRALREILLFAQGFAHIFMEYASFAAKHDARLGAVQNAATNTSCKVGLLAEQWPKLLFELIDLFLVNGCFFVSDSCGAF